MNFLQELAKSTAWAIVSLAVLIVLAAAAWWWFEDVEMSVSDGTCNIAVIPLAGEIVPFASYVEDEFGNVSTSGVDPDTFASAVRAAEDDEFVEGILVRIDSGGGTPAASEAIAEAIQQSALPVVALIREIGTSGAYLAATGADTIIASPFADVGSIGVSMSYLEYSEQNEIDGVRLVSLTSAPFKDYGSPDKELTEEERVVLERDLAIYHDVFVGQVAENRALPLDRVMALADGTSLPASLAQQAGLVDSLGNQDDARTWFATKLGLDAEDIVFCE